MCVCQCVCEQFCSCVPRIDSVEEVGSSEIETVNMWNL